MKLLCYSHVFPQSPEDSSAPFLLDWSIMLSKQNIDVEWIVPHNAKLKMDEKWSDIKISRFRYGKDKDENLCYRGEMHKIALKNLKGQLRLILFFLSSIKKIKSNLKKEPYSFLVFHWSIPGGLIALFLKLFFSTPYVIVSHGTDIRIMNSSYLIKPIIKFVLRNSKQNFFVSEFLLKLSGDKYGKTIPMPIRDIKFKNNSNNKSNISIMYAGRITQQKQIDLIAKALKLLKRKDWHLTIIGSGDSQEEILSQFDSLPGKKISILPIVSPKILDNYLSNNDIFILPSLNEGLGLTLIEAYANGCSIFGFNSGGIPEIINELNDGKLFNSEIELCQIIEEYKKPLQKKKPNLGKYSRGNIANSWAKELLNINSALNTSNS
jgi:glycosyltransferase involved in cell wall biosynthesis